METFQIRTDLALEARESVNEEESKLRGVSVDEHYEEETDIRITKVTIDTKNAEKTLGKPMGVYVTMEAPAMVEPDDDYHREISEALAEELLKMMPGEAEELSVLIVGLGNREVTADALGPQVVDNLLITRHVVRAYGKAAYNCTRMNLVSSIEPGVMAKTGMETAEIISGVVKETQPDVLIVVDALAARSTRRLNRTIQITNTGIQPGSGVGNHRNALTEETLGVPVIAIGIPTVVDAAGNHGNGPGVIHTHSPDQIHHDHGNGKCCDHHQHCLVPQHSVNQQAQFGSGFLCSHGVDGRSIGDHRLEQIIHHNTAAYRYAGRRGSDQSHCHRHHIGQLQHTKHRGQYHYQCFLRGKSEKQQIQQQENNQPNRRGFNRECIHMKHCKHHCKKSHKSGGQERTQQRYDQHDGHVIQLCHISHFAVYDAQHDNAE